MDMNRITIRGISDIRRLTSITVEQSFSKIMTIEEIIKKLAIKYGKLNISENGNASSYLPSLKRLKTASV